MTKHFENRHEFIGLTSSPQENNFEARISSEFLLPMQVSTEIVVQ